MTLPILIDDILAQFDTSINEMLLDVTTAPIVDQDGYDHYVATLRVVKRLINEVSEATGEVTRDLRSQLFALNQRFEKPARDLKAADALLRNNLATYVQQMRDADTPPKRAAGTTVRETWRAEVVDEPALIAAVADEATLPRYVTANMKELHAAASFAKGENLGIPGVKGVRTTSFSATASERD